MAGNSTITKRNLLLIWAGILLLVSIFPYVYMLLQSFASWDQVQRDIIPTNFSLRSYKYIFAGVEGGGEVNWIRALFNSFFVSFMTTFLMILTATMVAYALSKLRFKGKIFINNLILFNLFFPAVIILVPQFLVVKFFHMQNTYSAMIIPKMVSTWAVFMYLNHFRAFPKEIIEAARIDGARETQIIYKVILPSSLSFTTVVALFLFLERWNELLWDMIVARMGQFTTLNVLISTLFPTYGAYPGPLYAASVILTIPILVLFLIYSKNFKSGMQIVLK